jgi:hypothetical protein
MEVLNKRKQKIEIIKIGNFSGYACYVYVFNLL